MKPFFSIITPMFNSSALIGATIESVLGQDFSDWEMIVVDDASSDDGAGCKVVQSYADKDCRIKLIVAKVNKGSGGARNEAMKEASGVYFAFLDSDDVWHSDYLSTMKKHIDECVDESVKIYFSGYRRMNEDCTKEILPPFYYKKRVNVSRLLLQDPILPSACIVHANHIRGKYFFREELKSFCDDWVFFIDIMKQKVFAQGYSDILVDYRMIENSITYSKIKNIKPHWIVYRKILKFSIIKSLFCIIVYGIGTIKKYGLKHIVYGVQL